MVPRLSEFYGVIIRMYFSDHPPPHFHAYYGEYLAQVEIESGRVLKGLLPYRVVAMVQEWAETHQSELMANWERARAKKPLVRIEPLA